jgi:serine/threonine-protein kinase RsbW
VQPMQPAQLTLLDPMHHQREIGQLLAHHVVIPSDPAEARRVQGHIEQLLIAATCHDHDLFSIKLALEEALVNAIKHGNQYDRNKKVEVAYDVQGNRFLIHITDEGEGFDPADVPDPTAVENLERPCGRGLMLMNYYMTDVKYNERGNSVLMSKTFRLNGQK